MKKSQGFLALKLVSFHSYLSLSRGADSSDLDESSRRSGFIDKSRSYLLACVDAVIEMDPDGEVEMVNEKLTSLFSIDTSDIVGKNVSKLFEDDESVSGFSFLEDDTGTLSLCLFIFW